MMLDDLELVPTLKYCSAFRINTMDVRLIVNGTERRLDLFDIVFVPYRTLKRTYGHSQPVGESIRYARNGCA
jgi:hypothetical protein